MIHYKDLTASPNFFLMAGPCAIEDEETPLYIAERIVELTHRLGIPYIFKGSYRKANRSRVDSFTGIGDERALKVLRRVRETFDIPVVTDIHETQEAELAASYDIDVLQIPAFLCRQTDLIAAAARTGKMVNIKKGQFLAASGMEHAAHKVTECGNEQVILTERGRRRRPLLRDAPRPLQRQERWGEHAPTGALRPAPRAPRPSSPSPLTPLTFP